ncbi:hypothetical protein JP74_01750 [Devosia sp. 17-2-E-8]|nr:hypothetical protein JP74_01750 [Devosia sp. 17-2-E-8]
MSHLLFQGGGSKTARYEPTRNVVRQQGDHNCVSGANSFGPVLQLLNKVSISPFPSRASDSPGYLAMDI